MSKSHQLGGPFSVKWRWCYFLPALPLKVLTFWPRWLPPGIPVLSTALRTLLWILYDPGKNYVENIRENSNISKMSTPNCDQFMCMWSLLPKAPELVSSVHNMRVTITGDGQGDLFTHNKSLISWSIKCSHCIFKLLKHNTVILRHWLWMRKQDITLPWQTMNPWDIIYNRML